MQNLIIAEIVFTALILGLGLAAVIWNRKNLDKHDP